VSKVKNTSGGGPRRGEGAFRTYYEGLFGERWPALEAALLAPPDSRAFVAGEALEPYYLDSASVFAASCLELPSEGRILDACAAPGGKSLVIASRLAAPPGSAGGGGARLVANELSADRRRRLREVLDRHLSSELRSRVEVTGGDAAAMCRRYEASFDAILLDAPCSSERHVLADDRALAEWAPARIRGLAMRQWALLSSALIMLKAGGSLVYSTCALDPKENDGVVGRAAAKFGAAISIERPALGRPGDPAAMAGAEATEYGLSILPDRAGGAGPMYMCRMRKIAGI
jgi:16S rRNA C967 or C1407 C5-methylase (RsmB/RsmF family)